jgi:hypothetical protein
MIITRVSILQLYKSLHRYGQQLKFTDKSYFLKTIREEFRIKETQDIDLLYKKGQALLQNKRII